MNILVAGIPRSGSLRIFNIVRLGLEQLYSRNEINFGYENKFFDMPSKKHQLLKIHSCSDNWRDWADIVFTTKRDLRDILASSIDFGMIDKRFLSEERINLFLSDIVEKYKYWKQYTDLEVIYENYDENKMQILTRIFEICKLKVDISQVLEKIDFIANNRADKSLVGEYISKKHISDRNNDTYKNRLDEESLSVVEQYFLDWLKLNGYAAR